MKPATVSAAASLLLAMWVALPGAAADPKAPKGAGGRDPRIEMKSVPLELRPTGLKVSPDGRFLLCWGTPPRPPGTLPGAGQIEPTLYIVFDLVKNAVIGRQTLPQGSRAMLIDRNYVYVAPTDAQVVHRYRHAAKEMAEPADKLLLDYPPGDLGFAPDGRLLVVENRPGWTFRIAVYDPDTLKRIAHPLTDREVDHPHFLRTLWDELPDGLRLLDGIISDDRTGAVQCLTRKPRLPTALLPRPYYDNDRREPRQVAWGLDLRVINLTGHGGTSPSILPHGVHELLKFAPLLVSLRRVSPPNGGTTTLELDLRDLV